MQIGEVFYEYVPTTPCTRLTFFNNGIKVSNQSRNSGSFCSDVNDDNAAAACCVPGSSPNMQLAAPMCRYAGERLSYRAAQDVCTGMGMEVCDYRQLVESENCPRLRFHWTGKECAVLAKINRSGEVAVVHSTSTPSAFVRQDSPTYFTVDWNGVPPSPSNDCGGVCTALTEEDACLCEVEVSERPRFVDLPQSRWAILRNLQVGFPRELLTGRQGVDSGRDYTVFDSSDKCCDAQTVFETYDNLGDPVFRRNVISEVRIAGTSAKFRNPPSFNSLLVSRVDEAFHETEALVDHLFRHRNTAPFVAYRLIQRFGVSNPSPRYTRVVANAFRNGLFNYGDYSFGSSNYGDLSATMAALLLDRERRLTLLDNDPFAGSLREPLLKVVAVLRALEFTPSGPLVELNDLDSKMGQMAYEQDSVFSFFQPDHGGPALSQRLLTAPESELLSSGKIIGLLNGLFALVENGLDGCGAGFGLACYGPSSGLVNLAFLKSLTLAESIEELSTILTGGRIEQTKQSLIAQVAASSDVDQSVTSALRVILSSPEFHATNKIDSTPKPSELPEEEVTADGSNRYKAVVHIALRGGCDSYNVLVPHPSCSLHEEYKEVRGLIALEEDELLDINARRSGQPCRTFSLHRSLPYLKELYDEGDLLFLANTGVLTEPVDRFNYRERTLTRLFAHDSMQDEVDTLDPADQAVGTGVLGRMADVLQKGGFATGRTAVESSGRNLFGETTNPRPIFTLDATGVNLLDVDVASQVTAALVSEINGVASASRSGIFGEIWSSALSAGLNQTEEIFYILQQATTQTQTSFSESSLAQQLKLVAQLIATREQRGVDRDFFFVSLGKLLSTEVVYLTWYSYHIGGWDMHAEVTESLRERLSIVNEAVQDFVEELKSLDVFDDVTLVQTSEFARTLTPNSGGGTDHGYGGNYFMAGGSVRGNRIVGEYPSSLLDDSDLNAGRGRIIPTTPFDSPFHALAKWMGVESDEDMLTVLPNKDNFQELLAESDIFV